MMKMFIVVGVCIGASFAVIAQEPTKPRPKLFDPGAVKSKPLANSEGLVSVSRVREGLDEFAVVLQTRHAYSVIAPVPASAFEDALVHARRLARARAEAKDAEGSGGDEAAKPLGDREEQGFDEELFISRDELGEVLAMVLAHSIDGHGSVFAGRYPRIGPALPALIEPWEDASREGETPLFILRPNREPLVRASPTHTLLLGLDGRPTREWMAAARKFVPKGTAQLQDRWACGLLLSVPLVRRWLDVPSPYDLPMLVKLGDSEGKLEPIEIELGLQRVPDAPASWPLRPSGMIEPGIAYLRLPAMIGDTRGLREVRRMLDGFAEQSNPGGAAKALIIDLRNNGGGARDLIPLLADALLPAGHTPIVFTASRVLKLPGETELQQKERTEHRDIYTREDIRWNASQRKAIDAFTAMYAPKTIVPEDRFAPLHFGLLTPATAEERRGRSGQVISGRIIVLMNGGCFSAADVCLAALSEFPNVTLIGQPSAGGSGFAEPVSIMKGLASARLSTMATFRKDGSLFDGVGIMPDVLLATLPSDHVAGGTDSVLEKAVSMLRE